MRKYALAATLFTAASGLIGFVLRRSQLARAFEPDTGLPVAGAASTVMLLFYTVVMLAAALAFAVFISKRYAAKSTYTEAFAPASGAYLTFAGIIATLFVLAGFVLMLRVKSTSKSELTVAILTMISGLAIFGLAYEQFRGRNFKFALVYTVIPELFFTFWLLLIYRANQTNPVRYNYVFQCLAVAAAAIGFYVTTGFVYGRSAPGKFIFSHVAAVFFLAVGTADPISIERRLVFLALILFFLVNLARLTNNLGKKPPKPDPAETE
ncbi:MAG: hypothetical protein LBN00_00175 [Oscillospiraceae bacterium]|jgi:hypothetical protein|nr:hypothetical protein [Oscillospiraceae bacterium]